MHASELKEILEFMREVSATPAILGDFSTDAAFDALSWRHVRLQQDQQLLEWAAEKAT
jgi:hypothetical protein